MFNNDNNMAGIVFYFEGNASDVYSGREVDLSAWNNLCKIAQIDKAIIINSSSLNVTSFDADMDVQVAYEFPDNLTGNITQLVCPWETTVNDKIELWDFDHDTDWYIFGPSGGWVDHNIGDNLVTIPQSGTGASYALHVATTVMFHRYSVKR